ncbi:MAG: hypothetical protein Q9209_006620 [Squamulea sp. 1 TL-2023]
MAPSSFSSKNVLLAWATQVSLPQLGARLVAYTETRASITTFRLMARKAQFTSLCNLPEELLAQITSEVRETAFQHEEKMWIQIHACLTNTCTILSHIPQEDIDEYLNFCHTDQWVDDMEANLTGGAHAYHQNIRNKWCKTLTSLNGKSIFAKRVRIFAQDFGIRPYFLINRSWDRACHDYSITAEAYLILPTIRAAIDTSPGNEVATFAIKRTVDLSLLTGLSEVQLRKFQDAARALHLHRSDKNKKEPAYMADSDEEISSSEKLDNNNSSNREKDNDKVINNGTQDNEKEKNDDIKKDSDVPKPRLMMLGCGQLKAGHHIQ